MFDRTKVWIMAHRGVPHHEPENTLSSFRSALKYKPDYIELDIHKCKTRELVVIHDFELDRTTSYSGLVEEMSFKELRKLNAGTDAKKEKIPTLQEVIDLTKGKCNLNIEIKSEKYDEELMGSLLNIIKKNDIIDSVLICSYNHEILAGIKKQEPLLKTGALFINKRNWQTFLRRLYFTGPFIKKAILINADTINIPHQFVTKKILNKAHKFGIKIMAWTVDEDKTIKKILKLGADGIITNRADKFMDEE